MIIEQFVGLQLDKDSILEYIVYIFDVMNHSGLKNGADISLS